MYFIQGADQKQYGPISAEQLRQWISENRLNRSSPCRAEAEGNWKTLGDFPEFADAFTPVPAVPSGIPSSAPTKGEASEALDRLKVPAIAILVMSILGLLISLTTPIWYKAYLEFFAGIPSLPPDVRNALQASIDAGLTLSTVVQIVFSASMNILTLVGALRMKAGRSYGLSMTSAILVMLPCAGCCCLIGLPFGIWALVVMNQAEVRSSFR